MPVLIAIIVVAVIGVGAYLFTSSDTSDTTTSDTTSTAGEELARTDVETPTETSPDSAEVASSADEPEDDMTETTENAPATYSATANYLTPARTSHEIDVTLTLDTDGTITDAEVVYDNGDGYSNPNQERFDGAYQTEVVGMNIDEINLSRVGGASLTSEAFNEAVSEIRTQAS